MSTRNHRQRSLHSSTSSRSSNSCTSDHSRSTAPTAYSGRPLYKYQAVSPTYCDHYGVEPSDLQNDARSSVDTYASTAASAEDLTFQPQYELPAEIEVYASDSTPTIPEEFAELFEAHRRIMIEHDDSTSDGNMNLRLDTEITISGGRRRKMTLFHLRMRDLKDRQFSLRRYCRESGREVCKSERKFSTTSASVETRNLAKRHTLQQSISSVVSSLIGGKSRGMAIERRQESASRNSGGLDNFLTSNSAKTKSTTPGSSWVPAPMSTIRLEFSNYAQVEIHPSGSKASKRYDFEYWGCQYHWRRAVCDDGDFRAISYHLIRSQSNKPIAHITPDPLTRSQAMEEESRGGWIPPCSLFITDPDAFLTDLADVFVATGLMALVDDCIRRRWHSKSGVILHVPSQKAADYITPKRLIDEIFNRRSHTVA